MVKCRKELYCKYGVSEDPDDGEQDQSDKDPKRCFRCMLSGYSLFEPNTEDEDE